MPAPNSPHLPRVNHRKPPGQKDRLPTLPGPWLITELAELLAAVRRAAVKK